MKITLKAILFILFCAFSPFNSEAQTSDSSNTLLGRITIGVSNPKVSDEVGKVQDDKIKSRILKAVNKSSLSAVNTNAEFSIHSSLELYDEQTMDGLRSRTVVNLELALNIQQRGTQKVFSSFTKKLNGIGSDKKRAINNALKKVSFDESAFQRFINDGKQEIVNYYTNNCSSIIQKIQAAYDNSNFKKAIILSAAIPSEIEGCFAKAQEIREKAYIGYRNTFCKELLLLAKSAMTQNNFQLAGRYLSHVDPKSSCYKEAGTLLNQLHTEYNVQVQQQQEYNLEVLQIYATTQILTQYYGALAANITSNNTNQQNNLSSTGPNVFLLIVADTEDENIGKSTEKDMSSMSNLFKRATKEMGVGYAEKRLHANTFDKQNIYNSIQSFPVKNDDVFIFYYSGHGMNDTRAGSAFPTMNLDGEDVLLEKIHQVVKNKNARLTLTIGDLCNSLPRAKVKIETEKESVHKSSYIFDTSKLKKLLIESSGDAISTSSRKGQWSFCSNNTDGSLGNGQFTNAFLNIFADATSAGSKSTNINWTDIFNKSYSEALRSTKRRKNQDGSLGQQGFNMININE